MHAEQDTAETATTPTTTARDVVQEPYECAICFAIVQDEPLHTWDCSMCKTVCHKDCILRWYANGSGCPLCRTCPYETTLRKLDADAEIPHTTHGRFLLITSYLEIYALLAKLAHFPTDDKDNVD